MSRTIFAAAAFAFVTAAAFDAGAQVITWSPQYQFDTGAKPAAAIGYSYLTTWEIEVHEAEPGVWSPLWSTTTLDGYSSNTLGNWNEYALGSNPAIANLYGGGGPTTEVVQVQQFGQYAGALIATVGSLGLNGALTWSDSVDYASGYMPAVAASNGHVVEVHMASADNAQGYATLEYLTGTASNGTITWNSAYAYDNGSNPSVAVLGNTVVEVHQGQNGQLWYHVGTLNGATISWGPSHEYDNGYNPSVAISNEGNLVEVHQAAAGPSALWYHVGLVQAGGTVAWGPSRNYDTGYQPYVTWNQAEDNGLEVHAASTGTTALWAHPFELDQLAVPLYKQQGSSLCWAATGEMIMGYLGTTVTQCQEANELEQAEGGWGGTSAPHTEVACCSNIALCNHGGSPQFSAFGFSTQIATTISWQQLLGEIQANRPVGFVWSWGGSEAGASHVLAATGAFTTNEFEGPQDWVAINDPEGEQYDYLYSEWLADAQASVPYTLTYTWYGITKN